MGRSKGSQRSKGNTRPSSSGRSAELLNYSGKPLSGFVGFKLPSKDTADDVNVVRKISTDDVDSSVNIVFRLLMKKMLKRDAVTKLKALSEFNDFCSKEEKEVLISVLPFWPRLFNKLALDYDRRVREATHKAHKALLSKVKRDFAPYLKSIMGTWLIGQCDSYALSASAAQLAFSSAFPPTKQPEVLLFCKDDIFTFIQDNLFHNYIDSVRQSGCSNKSETNGPFDVIVTGTLRSMKLFLSLLSQKDQIKVIEEDVTTIVSNKKFWEFLQNKDPQVRGAWYSVASILCCKMPEAFKNTMRKLVFAALSYLSEEDPAVAPVVWECALSAMNSFMDYWMFIDVQKVVLPQLWAFLKDGGKGNATAVFPCLLPLISKFPKVITEELCFYKQLFHLMRKSLFLERIKSSSSECNAVIKAFFECLHYAVNCAPLLDKEFDFLQQIVIGELLPVVESSFTTAGFHLPVSCLYPLFGQFLNSLEVKAQIEQMGNKLCIYSETLTALWDNLFSIFLEIVNKEDYQIQNSDLSCLAYFFHCIHKPSDTLIKREKNVRFDTECNGSDNRDVHNTLSLCAENSECMEHITHDESLLFQNTIKFCKILWLRYEECLELSHMKLLSEMISAACCIDLFSELLRVFNVSCKKKEEAPIIFYHVVILSWLKEIPCVSTLDSIVDIMFCICSCVDKDSALGILNDTCKIEYERLFIRLVDQGLSHYKSDGIICHWLGSPIFGHALVNHVKNVTILLNSRTLSQELSISEAYCRSLYSCIATSDSGEILIDEECIKAILALFSHSFPDPATWNKCEEINEYNIIDFVCETCEHIFDSSNNCWNYLAFDSLMFQLFHFTLSVNENYSFEKLVGKASSVWKKSLLCIAKKRKEGLRRGNFIHQASQKLHSLLLNLKFSKSPGNLLKHILMFLSLLEEAFCSECLESSYCPFHIVSSVIEKILPTEEEWKVMKNGLNLTILPFILQGVIYSPLDSDSHILDCDNAIPEYVLTSKVISDLLIKATASIKLAVIPKESFAKQLLKHLPHILWSLTYATGNGYSKIESSKEYSCICRLEENSVELIKFLTKENAFKLIDILYDLSLSEGSAWSLPLQNAVQIVRLLYHDDTQIFFELAIEANVSDSCHRYITAQAFLSGVTQVKKNLLVKDLTSNILSSSEMLQDKTNLFGLLSEVCCCIQEAEVLKHSDAIENVIKVLMEMIDSQSMFAESESIFFQFVTQVSRILCVVIGNFSGSLASQHWNAIIDLLVSWVKKCKLNQDMVIKVPSLVNLMHQTSLLLSLIASKLNNESEEGGGDIRLCLISKSKWEEVFQDQISSDFLILFLQISESVQKIEKLPNAIEILLTTVCQATKHLTSHQILATFIPSFANGEILNDPIQKEDCVYKMFLALTPFLTSNIRSLQFAIHSIIIKIMPCVPKLLITKNDIDDDGDMDEKISENIFFRCFPLIEMLKYSSNIVDTMLLEIKAGDCCIVQPYTDSYTYTMAYLLAWNEVIEFFNALSSEDRSGYACYLESSKLLSALLYNLIRLMPENPLSCIRKKESVTTESMLGSLFLEFPALHSSDSPSSKELQHVACNVYFNTLKKAPALVRTWWNNLDKRTAEIIEKFTSRNVSGLLSQQEIQAVQGANTSFENMMVKARPLSKEVLATYTLDDSTIDLSIQLPPNYPLGPIVADSHGKIVVGQARWRNWLLQLTTFLNYQNGSIIDALSLWKKNLDKKFEGIEECMICFYVIHSSSYKLPNFSCSTCKKKFHSSCLFKWFSTSNNSTCPLCRNYF